MCATAARKLERLWAKRPWLLQEGRMLAGKCHFFHLHLQLDNYCRACVDLNNFDCQINALWATQWYEHTHTLAHSNAHKNAHTGTHTRNISSTDAYKQRWPPAHNQTNRHVAAKMFTHVYKDKKASTYTNMYRCTKTHKCIISTLLSQLSDKGSRDDQTIGLFWINRQITTWNILNPLISIIRSITVLSSGPPHNR